MTAYVILQIFESEAGISTYVVGVSMSMTFAELAVHELQMKVPVSEHHQKVMYKIVATKLYGDKP